MKRKLTKEDVLTIPNALSVFRILLIPVFVRLYVGLGQHYAAVAVVALSGLTDIADGYIARHYNMVSDVGKILDPIADKLTQAALLICLASRWRVIYWVFALLCLKELLQGLCGLAVIRVTGEVQMARWYGKVSTGVFYGTMLLLLLLPGMPQTWAYVLIGLCAAALALSMLLYVHHYLDIIWDRLFPGQSRNAAVVKVLIVLMWAAAIVFFWLHRDAVTVDGILRVTPHSVFLAVLFMLALFALKSLSVVVYSGILYAASGILFSLPVAIAVNFAGTCVMATLPYFLGKKTGSLHLDHVVKAHKNAAVLRRLRTGNTFLYTLAIRVTNLFPYDVISAYFGATSTAFGPYLLGSVVGMTANCVLFPILGMNITDPGSPQFILAAGLELAIILVSVGVVYILRKHVPGEEEPAEQDNGE